MMIGNFCSLRLGSYIAGIVDRCCRGLRVARAVEEAMTGGYVGISAAMEFISRFRDAPYGARAEFRERQLPDGTMVTACSIDGYVALLEPHELRLLADTAEATLREHPDEPTGNDIPNLILVMREAARRIDAMRVLAAREAARLRIDEKRMS
jgi:hypothetical protein